MQYLSDELTGCLDIARLFESVSKLDGETYRQVENRKTIRFKWNGKGYFAKTHGGVGWLEIFKNLSQLRLPVLGAANEWKAIEKLTELGIDTMHPVAYVNEGWNPARIHSGIVTRELAQTMSLEDYCASGEMTLALKRYLIPKIASVSRVLHENGVNHRDYYICHFLMDLKALDGGEPSIYLIDLHRAQIRAQTPTRWKVKDVGGLFFSAFDVGLTERDLYRFMKIYSGRSLRETLEYDRSFWRAVLGRAIQLYKQDGSQLPAWIMNIQNRLAN
jgi:heptose I phosphotransferase